MFNDIERKRVEKTVEALLEQRRPPLHLRSQVDLIFRIKDQSVEILEERGDWHPSGEKIHIPVAKTTFVRSRNVWKVYWQRADSKWHAYDPAPEVETLEQFMELVNKDEYACFFG